MEHVSLKLINNILQILNWYEQVLLNIIVI